MALQVPLGLLALKASKAILGRLVRLALLDHKATLARPALLERRQLSPVPPGLRALLGRLVHKAMLAPLGLSVRRAVLVLQDPQDRKAMLVPPGLLALLAILDRLGLLARKATKETLVLPVLKVFKVSKVSKAIMDRRDRKDRQARKVMLAPPAVLARPAQLA